MGWYLVMYKDQGDGPEATAARLAQDITAADGGLRHAWTGTSDFPAAALITIDYEKMEAWADRMRGEGAHEMMWLGAGMDGNSSGGNDSGHIKAGRGGGHIKAGNVGF
jgi:hypothetical protein